MRADSDEHALRTHSTRVLLHSGWATTNIGDVGHTPGTLRYLERVEPKPDLTLWLAVADDALLRQLAARFPGLKVVRGQTDARGEATSPALAEAIDQCEVFVQNSGMKFNQFWPAPVPLMQSMLAKGKRVSLFGQSFDGFAEKDEHAMARLLSQLDCIFCRDGTSLDYLQRIGVRPRVLRFGPDGCFGIDLRNDEAAAHLMSEWGLESRRFITVTLRTNTARTAAASDDALNPLAPTALDVAQDELWSAKLCDVITSWVRSTGQKVLLAPEVDKEIAHAHRLIWLRLPEEVRARVVEPQQFWRVDHAAAVYARAMAVVTMEPHSAIIALANGTPAIHYCSARHGVKRGMFRDIGLPQALVDIDVEPAERVVELLDAIRGNQSAARAEVALAMTWVHDQLAEMAHQVVLGSNRDAVRVSALTRTA